MQWTTLDRSLMTALVIGVWILIALHIFASQPAEAQYSRTAIERIVESCTVHGEVYIYSREYGEIESGYISC